MYASNRTKNTGLVVVDYLVHLLSPYVKHRNVRVGALTDVKVVGQFNAVGI